MFGEDKAFHASSTINCFRMPFSLRILLINASMIMIVTIGKSSLFCRLSTQRRIILLWSVSKHSPPNRTYTFPRIRLSTNVSVFLSNISQFVATPTECNGFSFSCNHMFFPRLFIVQPFEFPHMVHI